ncbi:hypothetical protein C7212DRAFT_280711 [Tuber magnatum]|uniref:RRM domain-containing protein n=1 Tax=Tuber magnatum TaxID=42249 RepID=A0A317SLW4_9PEZI|nr:hypothetical protein C7212DRAFT_280711 [Tuber magnatum]
MTITDERLAPCLRAYRIQVFVRTICFTTTSAPSKIVSRSPAIHGNGVLFNEHIREGVEQSGSISGATTPAPASESFLRISRNPFRSGRHLAFAATSFANGAVIALGKVLKQSVDGFCRRVSKLPTTLSPAVARSLQNNRLFAALHGTANASTATFSPNTAPMNTPPTGLRNSNNGGSDGGLSIRGASSTSPAGFSIRGSAGPFVVQAANFAPGTTAEDVKMAMRDLGRILSCIVLSPTPSVTCEIVFEKKDAADNCIAQFHNQLADGRRLSLALKEGPPISRLMQSQNSTLGNSSARLNSLSSSYANPNAAREEADRQRRQANVSFQDGSYGVRPPPLYSDALVQKGRGFSSR